ncbi:MAG: TIGR00266 family protein [Crenarchaeota archaeon]|nr:TIGR00266 family protein [Thermoproteota archaeon]
MEWRIEDRPSYSVLKVYLSPGESVTAQAGAMLLVKGSVDVKTRTGGFLRALMRAALGGESLFLNTYIARDRAEIWFVPNVPGDITYIDLGGEPWILQDSSYLAHHGEVSISVAWRGLRGVLAQGELVWLKAEGRGGVWVNSFGAIEEIEVAPGERVTIDNMHFVAMPASTRYRIRKFGGLKTFIFGGEGLVVEIEGPAKVYVQTRVLPSFAYQIQRYSPRG